MPTKVVVFNEKYFKKFNSLINSNYTVVWNPVAFSDVENHWSKEAVNDLGSRMVMISKLTYQNNSAILPS